MADKHQLTKRTMVKKDLPLPKKLKETPMKHRMTKTTVTRKK